MAARARIRKSMEKTFVCDEMDYAGFYGVLLGNLIILLQPSLQSTAIMKAEKRDLY